MSTTRWSLADIRSAQDSQFADLSKEAKALASQYTTLASRLDEPESLSALNDGLRGSTYVTGHTLARADLVVFASVLPVATTWKSAGDVARFRHILRWADLLQNTAVDVPQDQRVHVDFSMELPREVKEKKKKEEVKSEQPKETKAEDTAVKKELTEEEKKQRAEAAKAKKAAKAKANAEKQAAAAAAAGPPTPAAIDFRVGFIQKAVKHDNADSLYVSTIDVGDAEGPRTICSGLVKYVPLADMQERYVVVVANLKPVAMRGIKSCGMVLCAVDENSVEFVDPPAGSKPGDKLFFEGFNGTPEKVLNPKKKVWEACQQYFSTAKDLAVTYTEEGKEPRRLVNEKGEVCRASTLVGADVR